MPDERCEVFLKRELALLWERVFWWYEDRETKRMKRDMAGLHERISRWKKP